MKQSNFILSILGLFLFFSFSLKAQQDSNFNLYRNNMVLFNPATSGLESQYGMGVNVKTQWSQVPEAPQTQSAYYAMPVRDKMGVSVFVINDEVFVERQTYAAVGYSYEIRTGMDSYLQLGLSAGALSYDADVERLSNFSTDIGLSDMDGTFKFNFGLGAHFRYKEHFAALSVPRMLNSDRLQSRGGDIVVGPSKQHFNLVLGSAFELSRSMTLKPSTLVRYTENSPVSLGCISASGF